MVTSTIPNLDGNRGEGVSIQANPVKVEPDSTHTVPLSSVEMEGFTTDSLKKLQSTDERGLLDVVDKLRRAGLNGTIELPQLVVCGDQSSGKSSVLEAVNWHRSRRVYTTDEYSLDHRDPVP
jgi:hypothetical protein